MEVGGRLDLRELMPPSDERRTRAHGTGRVERSWSLLATTWRLVRGNRSLAIVALVTGLAQALALGVLLAMLAWLPVDGVQARTTVVGVISAFPLQLVANTCGVMLVAAGDAAMRGERMTVRGAVAAAAVRWKAILAWSVLAAGVGVVIEQLAARVPYVGRILANVLDVAWSLATLFAVPVLVLEPGRPRAVLRRSANAFRARWGESLIGTVTIGVLVSVPLLGGFALCVAGFFAGGTAGLIALEAGAVLVAAGTVVHRTAAGLFTLALYRRVTEDREDVAPWSAAQLDGGLALKDRKR